MPKEEYRPPRFDDDGINLADPHDARGHKTEYITQLQALALERYLGRGTGSALDLGCGYGRMTQAIAQLGYSTVGLDPSARVLRNTCPGAGARWCVGRLPQLPFPDGAFSVVLLLNVIRALHLLDSKDVCADAARVLSRGGRLVVLDNIREGDDRYVSERWFIDFFGAAGLVLKQRVAIRASRNPLIYLIRYGFVPRRFFARLACAEIGRMARKKAAPRWSYHNVLYVFERS